MWSISSFGIAYWNKRIDPLLYEQSAGKVVPVNFIKKSRILPFSYTRKEMEIFFELTWFKKISEAVLNIRDGKIDNLQQLVFNGEMLTDKFREEVRYTPDSENKINEHIKLVDSLKKHMIWLRKVKNSLKVVRILEKTH